MDPSETMEAKIFLELTRIPRPSGHMEKINGYLERFAEDNGLEHETDLSGNILIRRSGIGKTIVLQGHQDMVPNSVREFDFVSSPISTTIQDGWIRADGTTLGADDGGGLALMLCALVSPELEGASLECLFTTDEEIGLIGASNLAPGWLRGRTMINLDSEDADEITIGSAGSTDITARFALERTAAAGRMHRLRISGLLGGHSAAMIDSGRANAIALMAECLLGMPDVRMTSIRGGTASNVIPSACVAEFFCGCDPEPYIDEFRQKARSTFAGADPGIAFDLEEEDYSGIALMEGSTRKVLDSILSCPNGPLELDPYGVRTSSNIGIVDGDVNGITIVIKPRSSDRDALDSLISDIASRFADAGAEVSRSEKFPPWKEPEDSEMLKTAVEVYRRVFGKNPRVVSTHGGLESSTIIDKHPGMRAISIGPTVLGAHTPEERMDLSTLSRMREYLFELIRELGS